MKKQAQNKIIAGILLVVTLSLFALVVRYPKDAIAFIAAPFSGWLALFAKIVYERWGWLNLNLYRAYCQLFGKQIYWDVTAEFHAEEARSILPTVVKKTVEYFGPREAKAERLSTTRVRVTTRGGTFELSIQEDDGPNPPTLRLAAFDMPVHFRMATELLEEKLIPLLVEVEAHTKSIESQFHLAVHFEGSNPYYGLFVRRLGYANLDTFNVVLKIDEATVRVSKEKVTVSATTTQSLRHRALNYLALSGREIQASGL